MEKKTKQYIIILSILTVIFGILICLIMYQQNRESHKIFYPESSLSDSIFDSQNTTYTANENLPKQHSCTYIPYTIDTVEVDGVVVDTGTVYAVNENQFLFFSEILKGSDIPADLSYQFAQVLAYNVQNSDVTYSVIKEENGYINGFAAQYDVIKVSVPNGNSVKSGIVVAYTLQTQNTESYEMNYDFTVAVCSLVETTDVLSACHSLAVLDIGTIQYSKTLENDLLAKKKKADKESMEQMEEQNSEQTSEQTDTEQGTEQGTEESAQEPVSESTELEEAVVREETPETLPPEGDTNTESQEESAVKKMALHTRKDYKNLSVGVTWTNASETPKITITSPSGDNQYSATGVANGKASVYIGEASAGVYVVRIENYDACGEFRFSLQEN